MFVPSLRHVFKSQNANSPSGTESWANNKTDGPSFAISIWNEIFWFTKIAIIYIYIYLCIITHIFRYIKHICMYIILYYIILCYIKIISYDMKWYGIILYYIILYHIHGEAKFGVPIWDHQFGCHLPPTGSTRVEKTKTCTHFELSGSPCRVGPGWKHHLNSSSLYKILDYQKNKLVHTNIYQFKILDYHGLSIGWFQCQIGLSKKKVWNQHT